MKFRIYLSLLFAAAFLTISYSQQKPNLFDYDYAQFEYDSASNFVELYYSFDQSQLTIHKIDNSDFVEGVLKVSITDTSTNKLLVDKKWMLKYPVDTTKNKDKSLVGVLNFDIPEGIYKCEVSVDDQFNSKNKKIITDYMRIFPFQKDKAAISDIQLASKIIPNSENKTSIFYKNTFEVTPIPTLVFGQNIPVVFYYCEIYENSGVKAGPPIKLNCLVYNSKGKVFYSKTKEILRGVPSRVEVGTVLINKYPTDTYSLRITMLDSLDNLNSSSTKRFFVYNPGIKNIDTTEKQPLASLTSVFGVMSGEECDDIFAKSKYIATSQEISQYSKIDSVDAKREFLYQFWKKRSNSQDQDQKVTYQDYMKRVQESNQKFGNMYKPGWKTDRGRVLLVYGEPSEIDRYPNETNSKPYEIWHYNEIQGGVIFVFADLSGFSDYQLVNSTARGEYSDDNWQQRISQGY